jgi:hypothetical protein
MQRLVQHVTCHQTNNDFAFFTPKKKKKFFFLKMSKLYRDILYLIFKEMQYDKNYLASCLTVNKTWCEIVIPILWRNPWEHLTQKKERLLLKIIISYLSDETRNNLSQHYNFFTNSYKKPLFNYISFCRYLDLEIIEKLLTNYIYFKEIQHDMLNLFINENMEYTHLYIPQHFDHHFIPGAELCLTKIEFLKCNTRVNNKILSILINTCKSIKELKLFIYESDNNYGIAKLIENQKSLFKISFLNDFSNDKPFRKIIENSLVKHANTIRYFNVRGQLETQILTSFVNLKTLKLIDDCRNHRWNYIENLSLPSLKILYTKCINIESLTSLIENSGENLTQLKINYAYYLVYEINVKIIIQTIYQNCPNLMYLNLLYKIDNVLELEKLLIKCQHLNRLKFHFDSMDVTMDWDNLFKILATSSPPSLFKLIFNYPTKKPELESLNLFFVNWEGRQPVSLKFLLEENYNKKKHTELIELIEKYKAKGVVKKFDIQ